MSTVLLPATQGPTADDVPEACAGDRLTRAEFERRYAAMPHVKKAELIEGVVYMPSPVTPGRSWWPAFRRDWLGWGSTEPEPRGRRRRQRDAAPGLGQRAATRCVPAHSSGVRRTIAEQREIRRGAPELIAEVAASSVSYDLHDKLRAYRRNEVREYVVWRVWDRAIDWFVLREDRYERLAPNAAGQYRSEIFPGLWLDPAALLRGDLAQVIAVLQQGLASPEHADFVSRLQRQRTAAT